MTAGESPGTLAQSLCRPLENLRSRLKSDRGGGLAGDEDFEHAVLNEQLGKAFSVLAVVCVRVLSDDLLDGKLVFDREGLGFPLWSTAGEYEVIP